MANSQSKSHCQSPVPVLQGNAEILIPACVLSFTQATHFRNVLDKLILNCNVAKFSPKFIIESLWDTLKSPDCQTVEVDAKILSDLQRLAKIGDNLEDSILELINFYVSDQNLNIILMADVLEKRTSYTNFTSQFAHTLSRSQLHYPHIKVLFDSETSRLGIFCRRKKELSSGFVSSLIKQLLQTKSIFILNNDLPKTYKTNFAMLKQHLKQNLSDKSKFAVTNLDSAGGILIELQKD